MMNVKTLLAWLLLPLFLLTAPVPEVSAQEKSEKSKTTYSHTSSKGKTYYLFSREQKLKNSDKTVTMYYFASDPENKKGTPLTAVPDDRVVSETKSGMLVLKKKDSAK